MQGTDVGPGSPRPSDAHASGALSQAAQDARASRDPGSLGSGTLGSGRDGFLFDPYVGRAPPPPPKRDLSPAAIAAAILAVLPIGSFAAVFVGIRGLKQTKLGTLRGRGLAIASIVVGLLFTLGYGGAAFYAGKTYFDQTRSDEARQKRKWERKQREHDEEERARKQREAEREAKADPNGTASPNGGPPSASADPNKIPPQGTVPQQTIEAKIGVIPVVDLGVKETSLQQALAREVKAAQADKKEVVLMTTRGGCEPCAGFMASLPDSRMQEALANIRLVRADVEAFREDLEQLHVNTVTLAGFFLLTADGTPKDGINGGEWGADIAENIAPVINPFVRGRYTSRKNPFPPLPRGNGGNGTFL